MSKTEQDLRDEVAVLRFELEKAHRLCGQSIQWQRDAEIAKAMQAQEIERLRVLNAQLMHALQVIANSTETDRLGDTWVTQAAMVARCALEQARKG